MKCPNCGKEIANDSQFCEHCGTKIGSSSEKKPKKALWITLIVLICLSLFGGILYYEHKQVEKARIEAKEKEREREEAEERMRQEAERAKGEERQRKEAEERMRQEEKRAKEEARQRREAEERMRKAEERKRIEELKKKKSKGTDFTETALGVNMKMIWVEGGEFMMGCTSEQGSDCYGNEKPAHKVIISGYYIGETEVTQAQWELVMRTNPSYFKGSDLPVERVSWDEAMEFCNRLSQKTGKTYTLPTEAQWEYAARGGNRADGTKYAGSNMVDAVAWYTDNSGGKTHPCGTKRGNALGIYDMSGNVWEWCKDWYSSSYTSYDTNNPTGPSSGSSRVNRGGGWNYYAGSCRVSDRSGLTPSYRDSGLGLRVVLLP